ncbi:MAG TPA: ATP-binding protein [Chitinophagaceae bacterium]|nr:ATP-binding protein [Chitinophagaceae bacterium]
MSQCSRKELLIASFFVLINAYGILAAAQGNLFDSLKNNIRYAVSNGQKLSATLSFCDKWESMSPDTLRYYVLAAKQLALKQNDLHASIFADYYMAAWLFQANKIDTALTLTDKTISAYKKDFSYDDVLAKLMSLRGNILIRTDNVAEMTKNSFDFIKMAEEHKDTLNIARGMLGIGNADMRLKKYDETLSWYRKALQLLPNAMYKEKLSFIYNNIAIVFYHLNKEDSATYYVKEGIAYSQGSGNLTNLANGWFLYGGLMAEYKHISEAETAFEKAIEIRKKIGDVYYIISDMAQLALFYCDNNQPQKGIALCNEGINLLKQNGNDFSNQSSLYEVLAKAYLQVKDYKNYSDVLRQQLNLKDSIYQKNTAEEMAEMQAKYEVQKKEAEIAHQRLLLVKKNYLIYGSLAVFILLVFSSYQLFKRYRQDQKFRLIQAIEKEKKISERAVNEAEENERKRIAADLHDNLGAQANALLYGTEQLKNIAQDESVLLDNLQYTARDMMQSLRETAWAMKQSEVEARQVWLRIINFCKHLSLIFKEIRITTNGDAHATAIFSSNRALQIILIVQEAINNAVRHSGGDRINVESRADESSWLITVADNGQGFDLAQHQNNGIGLVNMKERADKAAIAIRFDTGIGKGTAIRLLIPFDALKA